MQLLPTIIIVSLLGFFILLMAVLLTWHVYGVQGRRKRLQSIVAHPSTPPRRFTLRSGRVIPISEAIETASTRPYSLDHPSPGSRLHFDYDEEKGFIPMPPAPAMSRNQGDVARLSDLPEQCQFLGRPPSAKNSTLRRDSRYKDTRSQFTFSSLKLDKDGSLTVPRPSLISIDRKRSRSRSHQLSNKKTLGSGIAEPSRNISIGLQLQTGRSIDPPSSPSSNLEAERMARDSHYLAHHFKIEHRTASPKVSSRIASGTSNGPLSLFTDVKYKSRAKYKDPSHNSCLSMTVSPASPKLSEPLSSQSQRASLQKLPFDFPSPPPTPQAVERMPSLNSSNEPRHIATTGHSRPSKLDYHLESPARDDQTVDRKFTRGLSLMSNDSVVTVASSDISSHYTVGNAELMNMYPSVADENATPPYARTLRSKYGQYPQGRRDKALPILPKSPLSQNPAAGRNHAV